MIRISIFFVFLFLLVGFACNKIETKKFHDNACESFGTAQDTIIIEKNKYFISAKINTNSEVQLRLHGQVNLNPDSLESAWVQIRSSNECYQAKSFKTRTDLNGVYFVVDYVVPTFIQVGYPAAWKLLYKGQAYYAQTSLTK